MQNVAAQLPPYTNRGVTVTNNPDNEFDPGKMQAQIHWLQGTTLLHWSTVLQRLVDYIGGAQFTEMQTGWFGYNRGWLGLHGIKVFATDGREDCMVMIPGRACDELEGGWLTVLAICEGLILRVSRIDGAIDGAPFTPAQCYEAFRSGQVRTRAHRDKYKWEESAAGSTFYVGSRSSDRFLRIYDQRETGTRVELELHAERAQQFLQLLHADDFTVNDFPVLLMGLIRDYIDFIDREDDANATRAVLLPWWALFVDGAERIRVIIGRGVKQTFERLVGWLYDQVAPSLAMLIHASGGDLEEMCGIVRAGKERWTSKHRALLAAAGMAAA